MRVNIRDFMESLAMPCLLRYDGTMCMSLQFFSACDEPGISPDAKMRRQSLAVTWSK